MGNNQPKPDAHDFAERLNLALDGVEGVPGLDTGRGAWIARKYKVSKPTGTGWVKGHYIPAPPRARDMAVFCNVSFDWLYFGRGAMNDSGSLPSDARVGGGSQFLRTDRSRMRDAVTLLEGIGAVQGVPALAGDPLAICIAYDFLTEMETPLDSSNVLDMTKRLAAKIRGEQEHDRSTSGETKKHR